MSRRTEARNLDLDLEQRENEAKQSQDDSTGIIIGIGIFILIYYSGGQHVYAIRHGRRGPRIVGSWAIAAEDVIKHRGAVHKKFANSIAGRYQARRFAFGTAWRWA